MKKIYLILSIIFIITITACTSKNNQENSINFNINKDFKVVQVNKNKNEYKLIIKSEEDISKYLNKLKENNLNKKIKVKIYLFHTYSKNVDFSINNLQDLRMIIDYNTENDYYDSKSYIELPSIKSSEILNKFSNEKVETTKNKIKIFLTIPDINNISNMVSQLKTYQSLVKELNNTDKKIIIIINNLYIFDGNNYLIKQEKCNI